MTSELDNWWNVEQRLSPLGLPRGPRRQLLSESGASAAPSEVGAIFRSRVLTREAENSPLGDDDVVIVSE